LFDNDRMEDRFVYHLKIALDRHGVRLLAWVVMPEHVHLIVFPETASPLSGLLIAIKRPLATEVLGRWRAVNAPVLSRLRDRGGDVHFWQAGAGTIGT
jgi:REP element-mobilizing transposase RayT